jgi:hypothetical protein
MTVKNPEGKSLCGCRDGNEERGGREGEQKAETGLREEKRPTQVSDRQEIAAK